MTKIEIASVISDQLNLPKNEAFSALEHVLEIMKTEMENGGEIKVSGFGKWEVKSKNSRRGRNPQTGETITLSERKVVTFKPSAILKSRVNS